MCLINTFTLYQYIFIKYQATKFVKTDVLDAYCWMYASFHVPPDYQGECTAESDPHDEGMIF